MAQLMSDGLSYDTQRNMVCAHCWGPVLATPYQHGSKRVACGNPDCSGQGFVSKAYVDQQEQNDYHNYYAVRDVLQSSGVIVNPMKGKTEADILAELGF